MKPFPARLGFLLLGIAAAPLLQAQITETPYTVEPGRLFLEIDGLRLAFDRADAAGNTYEAVGIASTIVSAGLTETVDVQIGADLFLRERYESGGTHESHSGIGDMSFRAKWTFWRSEEAGAAAVIPYVRVPTSTGGMGTESVEGGFIIPWESRIGAGMIAGAMLRWDVVRNPDDNGYDTNWLLSGYVHRELLSMLDVYAETALEASSAGSSDWSGFVGIGAHWKLSTRLWFDYEILRGVNSRATDWTHVFRVNWSL
ncbi:MAG: transporter [Opitutus sp.]